MYVYEYTIVLHPGGDGEGPTELLEGGSVLAQNRRQALLQIGRLIPDEHMDKLNRVIVQVRQFQDDR